MKSNKQMENPESIAERDVFDDFFLYNREKLCYNLECV